MMEYIKRLRLCIRWFQDLEVDYTFEHEKLRNELELVEQKCVETGMIDFFHFYFRFVFAVCWWKFMYLIIELALKNKEEELNLIIVELRKSFTSVQEKLAKEESDKLVRWLILNLIWFVISFSCFLVNICSKKMFLTLWYWQLGCNWFSCERGRD